MIDRNSGGERLFKIATYLILAVVLIASFLPASMVAPGRWNLGHLPAYLALTLVSLFAFSPYNRTILMVLGIAALFCALGLLIEFLQPLVGRTSSLVDLMHNVIGVFTGVVVYIVVLRMQRKISVLRSEILTAECDDELEL